MIPKRSGTTAIEGFVKVTSGLGFRQRCVLLPRLLHACFFATFGVVELFYLGWSTRLVGDLKPLKRPQGGFRGHTQGVSELRWGPRSPGRRRSG